MKKTVTAGISAMIGLSVLGASLSTQAHAGERQNRIAAGLAIGAVTGIIIAGELNRRAEKVHYRKKHRKRYHRENRRIRKHRHHQGRHQRRHNLWQRDRYYDDYDRFDRYNRHRDRYQPDRYFDDYVNEDHPQRRAKKKTGKRVSNNNQAHIQRCTKTYRSYDPQSDTYIGYDGKERVCKK